MKAFLPRIEISLSKIQENTQILCDLYGKQGISLMGVSKATLGEPAIAQAMIEGGVQFIADSRLENIQKMKHAGVSSRFVLLRTAQSHAETIIQYADISLNTELETLKALSAYAHKYRKIHQIIVMVELGDLREGVLIHDLPQFITEVLKLPNIEVIGIGCNLACYGGIEPSHQKMMQLSQLADHMGQAFGLKLEIVSGGNSANYQWSQTAPHLGRINNLRLGESILLGRETLQRRAIAGLHTNAFKLIAEVIESKQKPSIPFGTTSQDAFGECPQIRDRGIHQRVIIALGRQDTLISGIQPIQDLEVLGSSSDHTILENKFYPLPIGSEIAFNLDYGGLLAAMTSPFIQKQLLRSAPSYSIPIRGLWSPPVETGRDNPSKTLTGSAAASST